MRQHGNFIEWAPWLVLLMALGEENGAGTQWLHISGVLILAGRLVHPFGLKAYNSAHTARYVGNSASLLALVNAMGCLPVTSLGL